MAEPRSILHIAPEYPPHAMGGIATHLKLLAPAQAAAGNNVYVFVFHPTATSVERQGNLTVRFFRSARPAQLAVASGMAALSLLVNDCVETVISFFENLGQLPDIVHAHDWQCFLAASEIADKLRVPLVSTIHLMSEPMQRLCGAVAPEGARSSEHRLCRESSATITVSLSERRTLIEKYGADPARTFTVYHGIDPGRFAPPIDQRPLNDPDGPSRLGDDEQQLVLFTGRLDPQKGVSAMLRSAMRVAPQNLRVKWAIAGGHSPGQYSDELLSLVTGHPLLRERVQFLGRRSPTQLAALYRTAALALAPSIYEPFGYVVLEAMAAGIPIIATDTGGIGELIEHGVSGWLVPLVERPQGGFDVDVEALAQAQLTLLADVALRRSLAQQASEVVRVRFSVKKMVSGTSAVYSFCDSKLASTSGESDGNSGSKRYRHSPAGSAI